MSQVRIGVIGGSGIGNLLGGEAARVTNIVDTPFGPPSAPIVETDWHGTPVLLLPRHGAGHRLGPGAVPYRANLFALKKLGVTHVLATGAVGSLRQEFAPRDLVIPDQTIDRTRRVGTFFERTAVHVEFAEPFCPVLRKLLLDVAAQPVDGRPADAKTHDGGCYVAIEGPGFSSRSESLMHRLWGGDLVGMTALPEARLAKEAELPYALVALVTDYDSWKQPVAPPPPADGTPPEPPPKPDPSALLNEIIANLSAASERGLALVRRAIEAISADPSRVADCPASRALERAIWSDKAHIPAAEVERLAPLWLKYLRPSATPAESSSAS